MASGVVLLLAVGAAAAAVLLSHRSQSPEAVDNVYTPKQTEDDQLLLAQAGGMLSMAGPIRSGVSEFNRGIDAVMPDGSPVSPLVVAQEYRKLYLERQKRAYEELKKAKPFFPAQQREPNQTAPTMIQTLLPPDQVGMGHYPFASQSSGVMGSASIPPYGPDSQIKDPEPLQGAFRYWNAPWDVGGVLFNRFIATRENTSSSKPPPLQSSIQAAPLVQIDQSSVLGQNPIVGSTADWDQFWAQRPQSEMM